MADDVDGGVDSRAVSKIGSICQEDADFGVRVLSDSRSTEEFQEEVSTNRDG